MCPDDKNFSEGRKEGLPVLKYLYCFCAIFRYFVSNEKSLSENEAQAGGIPGKFFRSDFSKPAEKDRSGAGQKERREGYELDGRTERSDHS